MICIHLSLEMYLFLPKGALCKDKTKMIHPWVHIIIHILREYWLTKLIHINPKPNPCSSVSSNCDSSSWSKIINIQSFLRSSYGSISMSGYGCFFPLPTKPFGFFFLTIFFPLTIYAGWEAVHLECLSSLGTAVHIFTWACWSCSKLLPLSPCVLNHTPFIQCGPCSCYNGSRRHLLYTVLVSNNAHHVLAEQFHCSYLFVLSWLPTSPSTSAFFVHIRFHLTLRRFHAIFSHLEAGFKRLDSICLQKHFCFISSPWNKYNITLWSVGL